MSFHKVDPFGRCAFKWFVFSFFCGWCPVCDHLVFGLPVVVALPKQMSRPRKKVYKVLNHIPVRPSVPLLTVSCLALLCVCLDGGDDDIDVFSSSQLSTLSRPSP